MDTRNRDTLISALRGLLSELGIRPEDLAERPPASRRGPLRGPNRTARSLENIRRGASVTARAQAAALGHDLSRFYSAGEGRSRATCYTCDREAVIILGTEGELTTTGDALKDGCKD